jgi:hypothetical protein
MKPHDVERMTHSLIRHAARKAPPQLSERLEEEWLADLSAQGSQLSRLRFAIGCCWATRVIAYEYVAPGAALAGSSATHRAVAAFAPHPYSFLWSRTTVFCAIIALHVVLIYCLANAFANNSDRSAPPPTTIRLISPATKPVVLPDSAGAPDLRTRRNELDPIKETINYPTDQSSVVPELNQQPTVPSTGSQPYQAIRVVGGPDRGFPNPDDFYPDSEIRLSARGVATVQVCVDVDRRLYSDPTIAQSSGNSRLDAAALKLARAGSGHYVSTTLDEQPVKDCYPLRIRFQVRR